MQSRLRAESTRQPVETPRASSGVSDRATYTEREFIFTIAPVVMTVKTRTMNAVQSSSASRLACLNENAPPACGMAMAVLECAQPEGRVQPGPYRAGSEIGA
jgi:hypothetical protein